MADPLDDLRTKLRRDAAESDARLRQFVHESLTPERLQEDWDRLRGAGQTQAAPSRDRIGIWREFLASLWLAQIPQKMAAAASVVVLLVVGWWALRPTAIQLRTPAGWQTAGLNLPRELRVTGGAKWAVLRDPALSLRGQLEKPRGGATADLRVYDLRLEWRTPAGEPVVFSGTLVVTNAPGAPAKLSQRNVRGASLVGDIKIGEQPWRPFSQPYIP